MIDIIVTFCFIRHANFRILKPRLTVCVSVDVDVHSEYLIILAFRFTISFRFISFGVAMSAVIAVFYGFKWH